MSDLPNEIDRINALTSNARKTWFALLGVLVFVGITLMGVEHIDFYGVNRATKLPLVNVEVPTFYFFVAAPILTAAIYGYFHLYLIRLWDALGEAPARVDDMPVGDVIAPWLVSDAALHYRHSKREDFCATPRALEGGAMFLNFLLAWLFGLIILYFQWRQSMPARTFWMSSIACISFIVSLVVGTTSITMMVRRMRPPEDIRPPRWFVRYAIYAFLAFGSSALFVESYLRTEGPPKRLASLDMIDEEIVARPGDWLHYEFARAEFRAAWCRREGVKCSEFADHEQRFGQEWMSRRHAKLAALHFPSWHKIGRDKPDLRKAKLYSTFLAGVSLWHARLDGATLDHAQMESTALNFAKMAGTKLTNTYLERANLSYSYLSSPEGHFANMIDANLSATINEGGALRAMSLQGAKFSRLTDFRNVFLDGSVTVPEDFAAQMGRPLARPCQWVSATLSDPDFFSIWRWWILQNPSYSTAFNDQMWHEFVAPQGWEDVALPTDAQLEKHGLAGCTWQTDKMASKPAATTGTAGE
ncbi:MULTISPECIES: pentapeptide repeat-containing protein [unclassified Roseovarius]|uniref:pentapeptide repeat-containing protein n=1 Tax=unclassified Roseovarius TaxID=2614913 RepID=UPI00273ECC53|nr:MULTISPECIES: pentapeptide repeat-containing protein [unclassified Roseovarius]